MFEKAHAEQVESRAKTRTIRALSTSEHAQPIEAGDIIDCRAWMGVPYRKGSRKRWLLNGIITRLAYVKIYDDAVRINDGDGIDRVSSPKDLDAFARLDGFKDWAAMRTYFDDADGLPFNGILIEWDPRCEAEKALDKYDRSTSD